MDRYELVKKYMAQAIEDLRILAGDEVSDASWQDVAGTAAVNLRCLAGVIEEIREGKEHHAGRFPLTGPVVFPSPSDFC